MNPYQLILSVNCIHERRAAVHHTARGKFTVSGFFPHCTLMP